MLGASEPGDLIVHTVRHFFCTYCLLNGRQYIHLMMRRGRKIAKVAMAKRLAIRLVLDDAPRMALPASYEIRFARGTARTSPWRAVEHRAIDWAFHSSAKRSSK
jgi:hypothetical protein